MIILQLSYYGSRRLEIESTIEEDDAKADREGRGFPMSEWSLMVNILPLIFSS
jgi:hypothetical protein